MRIPDVPWYWRQLSGPTITNLMKAISTHRKEEWEDIMNHYDKDVWNLDTCSEEELLNIARILGIPRPMLWNTDDPAWEQYLRFAMYNDASTSLIGLGSLQPGDRAVVGIPGEGGWLSSSSYTILDALPYVPLKLSMFRIFVKSFVQSAGEIGSLVLLDDIIYNFQTTVSPSYTYQITPGPSIGGEVFAEQILVDISYPVGLADEVVSELIATMDAITRLWRPNILIQLVVHQIVAP